MDPRAFVLALFIPFAYGYSSGAPSSVCSAMTPVHGGSSAQTSLATNYQITTAKSTYTPGETLTVTITANNGAQFKGYLIQARTEDGGAIVGSFAVPVGGNILPGCGSSGAVTHTSPSGKTSQSFTWTAPSSDVGQVAFVSTIVQSYSVFWMNVKSSPLSAQSVETTTTRTTVKDTTTTQTTKLDTTTEKSTLKTTTVTTPPSVTQRPIPQTIRMDSECGITKGCFVDCGGNGCEYQVTWQSTDSYVDFSLSRRVSRGGENWIAVGFSDDLNMGDDEVIYCYSDGAGQVDAARSFNQGTANVPVSNPKEGLGNINGSYVNGIFTCSFRSSLTLAGRTKRQTNINARLDLSRDHNLMFGDGPSFSGSVAMHTRNPVVTAQKVDFQSTIIIGETARYPLMKVHACLMILAWIFCTGVAIILARFYKPVWSDKTFLGVKIWFQLHRGLMVTTLVLTIVGFIIIFVEAGGYSQIGAAEGKEYTKSHPILGIIVTILTIANPIMALFRPDPKDKNRPIFNWAHWAVGMAAQFLAVLTICFGTELQKVEAPSYTVFVVIGYVVYDIVMEVILRVFDLFAEKKESIKSDSMEMKNGNSRNHNGNSHRIEAPKRDPKDSPIKKVLLVFHVMIAFAFTLTLLLLVTLY